MAIEIVRIQSETPNVSNTDDFVGFRYAYGNQNGYVINKGQECSYTINGSKFKINSGRLVLQGIECDIDANGVEIIVDNVATKRYYTIYLQVNLALNETKILTKYDTATYPNIDTGDDLTLNTTGTAKMELYHFDVTSGVISNVNKIVNKINYTEDILVNKAKQAINSIRHEDMSYTGFRDVGGVLKTENEIISKKILVWEGTWKETDGNLIVGNGLKGGDKIEIEYQITSDGGTVFGGKIYTTRLELGTSPKITIQTILYSPDLIDGLKPVTPFTAFSFLDVWDDESGTKEIFVKNSPTFVSYIYADGETVKASTSYIYKLVLKKIYKIVE